MKKKKNFLSGKFLIASPSMSDPRFHKSVIYIITHKSEGAMGIVINQPIIETKINNSLFHFDKKVNKKNIKENINFSFNNKKYEISL